MSEDTNKRIKLDWRVLFGIAVTSIWLIAGLTYIFAKVGFGSFADLPVGEIGSFLEGAFAPLAFLWLVIGHFMQQSEISANTKVMQAQEQSIKRQELHSQRDGFFKLLELVQGQLGSIAGFHYVSVVGPTGTGEISAEDYAEMRGQSANGDSALFVRKMIGLATTRRDEPEKAKEIFLGTDIRKRHCQNFEQTFEKILTAANQVDHDDLIENALLFGSPWGMYYRILRFVQGKDDVSELDGFATIQGKN